MFIEITYYNINRDGLKKIGPAWILYSEILCMQLTKLPELMKTKEKYYTITLKNGTIFGVDEKSKNKILLSENGIKPKYV